MCIDIYTLPNPMLHSECARRSAGKGKKGGAKQEEDQYQVNESTTSRVPYTYFLIKRT